jgi:hypothetical protein
MPHAVAKISKPHCATSHGRKHTEIGCKHKCKKNERPRAHLSQEGERFPRNYLADSRRVKVHPQTTETKDGKQKANKECVEGVEKRKDKFCQDLLGARNFYLAIISRNSW